MLLKLAGNADSRALTFKVLWKSLSLMSIYGMEKYILFFKIFFVYFKKGTGLHLFVV